MEFRLHHISKEKLVCIKAFVTETKPIKYLNRLFNICGKNDENNIKTIAFEITHDGRSFNSLIDDIFYINGVVRREILKEDLDIFLKFGGRDYTVNINGFLIKRI